eukprot:CAMPEP_0171131316 /NCGR_PEP_ID=MMETSP0766_2-20121228/122483_1 /TAXON_ID=439317 /ORGANISM="Gambierdiscus australes, Strain CAWD 149" /LENGTH=115 /DNA_ID=CAMNT_0011594605 /DNA_START=113 /DNA_END=458 /DNA_ORIENTATION=+
MKPFGHISSTVTRQLARRCNRRPNGRSLARKEAPGSRLSSATARLNAAMAVSKFTAAEQVTRTAHESLEAEAEQLRARGRRPGGETPGTMLKLAERRTEPVEFARMREPLGLQRR